MELHENLRFFKLETLKDIFHFNEEQVIAYYDKIHLFFDEICKSCNFQMTKKKDLSKTFSNQNFICSTCGQVSTKRSGTIFENMKIPFRTFNLIVYYFSNRFTTQEIFRLLTPLIEKISLNTIKKYVKSLRLLIHIYVQQILSNTILPGPVEIDEACCYKLRRGNCGRLAKTVYWIFGLKCRTTKKVIIYPILYRNRATIIPIIRKHVSPGAIIYSDMFSCYFNNRHSPPESHLKNFGFTHYGVNHSIEFVSSIDASIHTNTIERVWRGLKGKLRDEKPRKYIHEFISEYIMEGWIAPEDRYFFIMSLLQRFHHA